MTNSETNGLSDLKKQRGSVCDAILNADTNSILPLEYILYGDTKISSILSYYMGIEYRPYFLPIVMVSAHDN